MEILTDKTLHNGDGLCFLNKDDELIGIRADVVNGNKVSCNRPHGAQRGFKIYRNYDIEWQRQVEASTGNRKIDIELVLSETPDGFELQVVNGELSPLISHLSTPKIPATNPEKALENIRKKALQWGDTIYNPVSLELRFSQPYLIPASVIGEMKRGLLERLMVKGQRSKVKSERPRKEHLSPLISHLSPPLMTCHHCIRYANGMCPKITGKPVGPLFIRNGGNTFRLEFDCKNCLMYVCTLE